jgi:hypothetical protein
VQTCVFGCGLVLVGRRSSYRELSERSTRVNTVDDEDIGSSGLVQVNDGLYAEVTMWCASAQIARRRIDLVCLEAF